MVAQLRGTRFVQVLGSRRLHTLEFQLANDALRDVVEWLAYFNEGAYLDESVRHPSRIWTRLSEAE